MNRHGLGLRKGHLKVSRIVRPRLLNKLMLAYSKTRPLSRLGRSAVTFIRSQDLGVLLASGSLRSRG